MKKQKLFFELNIYFNYFSIFFTKGNKYASYYKNKYLFVIRINLEKGNKYFDLYIANRKIF